MSKIIRVKQLTRFAKVPERAFNSAGYDLFSAETRMIPPGDVAKIKLGIAVEFSPGYAALIWDRSSLGSKGIHRFAGVIDADYRGEWMVCLHNTTRDSFFINVGDKIAQVLFQKVESWDVEIVDELPETERGEGGFGSTGR